MGGPRAATKHQRLPPMKRSEWLEKLEAADEEERTSPRITTVIRLVTEILTTKPGEKIIVASRFVKFLDILEWVFKTLGLETTTFSGYCKSERDENLGRFCQKGGPVILLLSATSGGTGLNITRATHLIICEPLWTPGLQEQLMGRFYRLGQQYETYAYHLIAKAWRINGLFSTWADLVGQIILLLGSPFQDLKCFQ